MRIIGGNGKIAVLKYTVFSLVFLCACIGVAIYSGRGRHFVPERSPVGMTLLTDGNVSQTVIGSGYTSESTVKTEAPNEVHKLIMIDAGHGGEDGGAVSDSGILEKDLNLSVSDNLAHFCLMFGLPYKMTREDDSLLYDKYGELTDYTGKKKSYDLKNRLKYSKDSGASLLISVHMNKFSDVSVNGLQVYYSKLSDNEKGLADSIHSFVLKHFLRGSDRSAKAADSSIYLLNKSEIPAVLVEFGFLSNPTECALLSSSPYRASISATVFVPILEYFVRS